MDYNDNILGTKGIIGENLSSGVGFVIIPPGVDIEIYKEDCFASNTVSITGFDFGHIHNVPVDKEVMQTLEFPKRIGEMGSPVVFVNIPKHNVPVVVACLKNEKDVFKTHEKRIRKTKSSGSKVVDLDMDADDARIAMSVNGDELIPAIIELLVKGNNSKNYLKVEVDGTTFIKSKLNILTISNTKQEFIVLNKKGVVVGKIKLSSVDDERFLYQDDFQNEIIVGKSGQSIKDKSGNIVTIDESGVNVDAADNGIKLVSNESVVEISEDGVNIDSGNGHVTINGDFEALYNTIPGMPIANISQIGVSKKVKIG